MPKVDPREAEDPSNAMLAALVDTLEAHGVEYAFTGSFTLAFWSQPRSSKDIDVVVLLEPDRSKRRALLHDLATAGFGVPTAALDDLERVHATALDLPLRHGAKLIVELIVPEPEREALSRRIVSRARSSRCRSGLAESAWSPRKTWSSTSSSSSGTAAGRSRPTT
ncbi:MAG: hypothetical protein KIT58_13440 [Planctomycetota bacterium]|nr:hypothetical protein [Planctomycetota bacterium]